MSRPFIIWTMQRSGGTALTELLMEMSEHRSAEHEPFNWARKNPRQFWPIADAWNKTRDAEALAGGLEAVFSANFLLKHCYELLAMPFNEHLMQAAAKTHYRHVHLLRRDEQGRLLSKFVAEAQGTWFRDYARKVFAEIADGTRRLEPVPIADMVTHYRLCRNATETVAGWLAELGPDARRVYFEDLYDGERDARLANIHGLLRFLGFTDSEIERHGRLIDAKMFHAGQRTRDTVATYLPNYREACQALSDAGCPAGPANDTIPAKPAKPGTRLAAEFRRFAERQTTAGPYLEIGVKDPALCALANDVFEGERHLLGPTLDAHTGVLRHHRGEPSDLSRFADGAFRTVLWNDALVHDRRFWVTLDELRRILAPGGLLILSVPGFSNAADRAGVTVAGPKGNPIPDTTPTYRIHASPDFWRISPQAMRQVVLDGFDIREVRVSSMPPRIFGVGVKPDHEALRAAAD